MTPAELMKLRKDHVLIDVFSNGTFTVEEVSAALVGVMQMDMRNGTKEAEDFASRFRMAGHGSGSGSGSGMG